MTVCILFSYACYPYYSRNESFLIERKPEFGGNAKYEKFEELEEAFGKEEVHPGDLKNSVVIYLNRLLDPVRKKFETPELKKLTAQAYPDPNAKPVTKKGPPTAAPDVAVPSRLNIKVGKIVEVTKHPEAEALYIEKIDVGEGEPRTIGAHFISHLNEINYLNLERLENNSFKNIFHFFQCPD